MLGNTIGMYRRKLGLTQEQLAQKLDVTNQAVSKWEGDQCCPDVSLLPRLADVLGISLDTLFGRPGTGTSAGDKTDLPWENDGDFRVVLYCGHELIGNGEAGLDCSFHYEGPVRNIYCDVNLHCDQVLGNVSAGGSVECGDVTGDVSAGSYVECGDVSGNVGCGGYVECGDVDGSVSAGAYVECGDVGGNVTANHYAECGNISGDVQTGDYVECGDIGGNVTAGGTVSNSGDVGIHASNKGVFITISDDKKGKQKFSFNPFRKDP